MPANVTPEYEKAERRFREADSDAEKLDALQEMLSTIPKHKGTEKMQADIKRRISQLRKSAAKPSAQRGPDPFHIPKSGAGQVALLGAGNVGKSSLVAATTNAPVKVADYPFATVLPVPGMWAHEDVQIELVDTPPILAGQLVAGLMGLVRLTDVVAVVVDAAGAALEHADSVLTALAERDMELVTRPLTELDERDRNTRCGLLVANKIDLGGAEAADAVEVLRELYGDRLEVLPVSAETGEGLDALRRRLWELLCRVRVYTKQPGEDADYGKPFVLPAGATVEDLARAIHRELPEQMKYARIWGEGRFDGQHVHRTEALGDRDVVEIHE